MTAVTAATVFLDPICPWAWMTSRWALEVESVRPITFTFAQMSLSALNEGRDLPADYRKHIEEGWFPARVLAAAIEQRGDEVARPLYSAMGERIHPGKQRDLEQVCVEALAQCGLPESLLGAGEDQSWDELLRAKRDRVVELVGDDVGTPTIAFEQEGRMVAFFGPVVTPAPKGEAAGLLWDGCALVAATPGFYELKRSRSAKPDFS